MSSNPQIKEPVLISAVIITFNEERNIRRCLDSLKTVADEIVVVDSFSTDNTRAICEEYGAKVISRAFTGYGDQKNFATRQASFDWILSLDADEVLSTELSQAILNLKKGPGANAFYVKRLTNYCGAWIKHCGWYPDRRIRLWKKDDATWTDSRIHEVVKVKAGLATADLEGDLFHYSYHSISDHVRQLDKFSTIMAEEEVRRKKRAPGFFRMFIYPWIVFIKMYFVKLGFMDGVSGFIVCVSGAYYRFLKYAKAYAMTKGLHKNEFK